MWVHLYVDFFQKYTGNFFGDLQQFGKTFFLAYFKNNTTVSYIANFISYLVTNTSYTSNFEL